MASYRKAIQLLAEYDGENYMADLAELIRDPGIWIMADLFNKTHEQVAKDTFRKRKKMEKEND